MFSWLDDLVRRDLFGRWHQLVAHERSPLSVRGRLFVWEEHNGGTFGGGSNLRHM